MSCCQQNAFRQVPNSQFRMQSPSMENFTMSPTDYNIQNQSWVMNPPLPVQNTGYDMGLQNQVMVNSTMVPTYNMEKPQEMNRPLLIGGTGYDMGNMDFQNQVTMQSPSMENFMMSPTNYDMQKQTYEIDPQSYYAPPWPVQRTVYDMGLQNQFNTIKLPDYLNFSDDIKRQQGLPDIPSIKKGRYDNYSY